MSTICAIVIVIAGFKMVTAGGNVGQVSDAKSMITNTIVGFIILLAAWLIVDTVLKVFVSGSSNTTGAARIPGFGPWNEIECVAPPTQPPVTPPVIDQCATASNPQACTCEAGGGVWNLGTGVCEGTVTPPPPTACAIPALTPITDAAALQMEGGQTVVWTGTDARLQTCVNRFIGRVGGSVTSAYRPQAYQNHFIEIRDRWCTQRLQSNTTQECSSLRSIVSAEVSRHFGSNWQCGAVGNTSPSRHTTGTGVDISGINHSSQTVIQAASDNCLTWRNYPGDPYHYDLRAGCTCN
jgi:hypothetical protein